MHQKDRSALAENSFRGASGFEKYYSEIYGERWQVLRTALLQNTNPISFDAGGKEKYFLDAASVVAASSLPLENAENILDMCAAPGGKTLVLASRMKSDAHLTSNDRAVPRVNRLTETCNSCLPEEARKRVAVTCSDAAKMCKKQSECYDAILLDAPCSSERHVLQDEKELAKWSPARIRQVTTLQWSLLSSAYRLLKNGGFILYSTCAINESENDKMIERLLSKFDRVQIRNDLANECNSVLGNDFPKAVSTKYGNIILPDVSGGAGPIYFSLVYKEVEN